MSVVNYFDKMVGHEDKIAAILDEFAFRTFDVIKHSYYVTDDYARYPRQVICFQVAVGKDTLFFDPAVFSSVICDRIRKHWPWLMAATG